MRIAECQFLFNDDFSLEVFFDYRFDFPILNKAIYVRHISSIHERIKNPGNRKPTDKRDLQSRI